MLEWRDVSFAYGGDERGASAPGDPTRVVDGVSLTVDPGEFVVLAGANGSGKTSLLRLANGLLEPDSGTVLVDDHSVHADLVRARTSVGMVFQNPRDGFVAATVGEDVAFGPENLGLDREEIDRRVEEALTAVNLDNRTDDRIDELSGGERARVAIAGALAMTPAYLLLDEPFTGLDAPARASVLDRLATLATEGTAVVIATHDLRDVLGLADRVVALADGRVTIDADPESALDALDRSKPDAVDDEPRDRTFAHGVDPPD